MSKEEKMMILQMVSEGKITPEQGAELLRAVGDTKPESPAAPKAPPMPPVTATQAAQTTPRTNEELSASVQKKVEAATRRAEAITKKATSQAEEWASKFASEGENLGKILGESGENLGKIIGRVFGGNFSNGSQFEFHEEMRGEFPTEGELQVDLSTQNGRITVDTWDGSGYRLDVRKTLNAATEAEAKEIASNGFEFRQEGLNLTARAKENSDSGLFRQYSIGFTLTLPRDRRATLKLASSNGRIAVGGVSGTRLNASTSNGRVEVEGCSFESTDLGSANGRIEFDGHPGDLTAGTANGRITARLSGIGQWKLSSANGKVEVEIRKEAGAAYAVEASTVMGKIEVTGLENAEILVDETKSKYGSRRYQAETKGFGSAERRASLRASTSAGKVSVTF